MAITCPRTTSSPSHLVADKAHRITCLVARGIEAHVPQQHQHVHRGVPPAVPCRAAPPSVGPLEGEQLRARALGCDLCTLGPNLVGGCIGQIAHHLPAYRGVGIEQPAYGQMS